MTHLPTHGTAMPRRVQRRRTAGWKMPPNTVYVGRPSKWGNPFSVAYWTAGGMTSRGYAQALVTEQFRACLLGEDEPEDPEKVERIAWIREHLKELRGKNLACWCKPGTPCHADILLEEANR